MVGADSRSKGAPEERRRFYRLEDDIALKFRVLEGREVDASMQRVLGEAEDTIALAGKLAATSDEMRRGLDAVKRDLPDVANYLEGLNKKLDVLSRLIIARDSGLPSHPTHSVDLSASGMSFSTDSPVPVGSLLELQFAIFPSNACIMTVGAVVTCNEIPTDESPYRLGVDFSYIRDDDQELLVKHVVQKQSRSIRKTRPVRG